MGLGNTFWAHGNWDCTMETWEFVVVHRDGSKLRAGPCNGAAEAELWWGGREQKLCPDMKWWDQIPGFLTAQESWRGAPQLPDSSWSGGSSWNTNRVISAVITTGSGVTLTLIPSAPLGLAEVLQVGVSLEGFSIMWYHNHGITEVGKVL